jgi:hypothetical protein
MVNYQRVRDAQIDSRNFVPAMRDEVRAWLAPICDCLDLQKSAASSLLQKSRNLEGNRVSDDRNTQSQKPDCFSAIRRIPKTFLPELLLGGLIDLPLAIIGEDQNEYQKTISLWVDPVMKRQQGSSRRIFGGLYGGERSRNLGSTNFGRSGKV